MLIFSFFKQKILFKKGYKQKKKKQKLKIENFFSNTKDLFLIFIFPPFGFFLFSFMFFSRSFSFYFYFTKGSFVLGRTLTIFGSLEGDIVTIESLGRTLSIW